MDPRIGLSLPACRKWRTLRGRHSGGNPLQYPVRSDGVDSGPHEQCGSTTSLDDHCLVAGISCWLYFQPWGLAEAPRNHSDLAKIEEKGGYIAPETPPGCLWYRRRGFGYENKQTKQTSNFGAFVILIWPCLALQWSPCNPLNHLAYPPLEGRQKLTSWASGLTELELVRLVSKI